MYSCIALYSHFHFLLLNPNNMQKYTDLFGMLFSLKNKFKNKK